jgi:hypothetical protein
VSESLLNLTKYKGFLSNPNAPAREKALLLIVMHARGLYADVCDALERANQDDNALCLLLSNGADDLASLISGLDMVMEATA